MRFALRWQLEAYTRRFQLCHALLQAWTPGCLLKAEVAVTPRAFAACRRRRGCRPGVTMLRCCCAPEVYMRLADEDVEASAASAGFERQA